MNKNIKMNKNISIIIATYNAAKTLRRCLDSIVPQLTDETELILVDGGSQDDTNKIIDSYGEKVTVHISEPDKGIYDAWNKGVKVAKGRWIAFIGADDWLCEGSFSKYFNFIHTNGDNFDLICAKLYFVNSSKEIIKEKGEPWNWKKLIHRRWNLAHPGMLHNRECFERIGLFDIQYKICGDIDFLLRLGPNIKTGFIDDFIVYMSSGGVSDSFMALEEGYIIRKKNRILPLMINVFEYYKLIIILSIERFIKLIGFKR